MEPDTELARALQDASEKNIVFETAGARFRVVRDDADPFKHYDARRVEAALDRSFGTLKGLNVEAFVQDVRSQRRQDSQGRPDQ